jgi:hypothetical protein
MLHLDPSEPLSVSWERALRRRVSERDLRILLLARRKMQGVRVDFDEAIRALREAVEESIPAGRVFLLGFCDQAGSPAASQDLAGESVAGPVAGPIVGSLLSGVGIADGRDGVRLLRVTRDGRRIDLGRLVP